jgi:hypothetical protein
MAGELGTVASVGFRHVVEDGLSLLKDRRLPAGRREYVLDQLSKLLNDAARGQQIVANQALFVGSRDRDAYESYSLLDRHLRNEEWEGRLKASQEALRRLLEGSAAPREARSAAIDLLKELLTSLERDASGGLASVPEDLDLSR